MGSQREYERIVVRAPNWVGDAVMATPFFSSLKKTFPHGTITCLCRPVVSDIFRHRSDTAAVTVLDESRGRSGWASVRRNASLLRDDRFDLAISLPNSLSAALIFFLAGVPERVGYRGDWRRVLLTKSYPFPPKSKRQHRADSYLELLKLVSPSPSLTKELSLTVPADIETETAAVLDERSIPRPFMTIAPGAAQPNKMWMPDRFIALISRLNQEDLACVVVGGPHEADLCAHIATESDLPVSHNLAGTGSLLHTAAIIRESTVFVGNDSGLAHVAAAVKTPVVVLSGPGDPREVAPYTETAMTIAKSLFCKPCYKNECWRKDAPLECLQKITVEDVLTACGKYLPDRS